MDTRPLDTDPIGEFLLDLAEREATGYVEVGRRRIALSNGRVVGISPAEGDQTLGEFLLKSGKVGMADLAKAQREAESQRVALEVVLLRDGMMKEGDLAATRRSLWLERLVHGLRAAGAGQGPPPALEHGAPPHHHVAPIRLVPLVLDALARCATETDAAAVGMRLNDRLTWIQGPHTETARKWAALGTLPEQPTVSRVLAGMAAAAPTIAALVRAGLAELTRPGTPSTTPKPAKLTLPPPPPRLSRLPPPSATTPPPPPTIVKIPAVRSPRRGPDLPAPGQDISTITPTELRQFSLGTCPFEDPIAVLEDRIAMLEDSAAPSSELAEAWCELGHLWRATIGSTEEAARAYREAAAADPSRLDALENSAILCSALGQTEWALAYAEAAADAGQTGARRALALRLVARIARAKGDVDGSLEALCEAAAEDEADPGPHELIARLLAERGNVDGAVAHARLAAGVWSGVDPERARAVFSWAYSLRPAHSPLAAEYAAILQRAGRGEAAVAVLADAASQTTDIDLRRTLSLGAAERAEEHERPDLAAELLTEAFDAEPYLDVLYEPLFQDLEACAHAAERAVMAEEFADICPDDQRAVWLQRAADAYLQLPGEDEKAVKLFARAVAASPLASGPLDCLREHSQSSRARTLLATALQQAAEASVSSDLDRARDLFEELAVLAEEQLGAVHQALWAWHRIHELFPENSRAADNAVRLSHKARIHDGLLEAAERELAAASPEDRHNAVRKVAAMLTGKLQDRSRAAELYSEFATAHPEDDTAASALEWLLDAADQYDELAEFLTTRAQLLQRSQDKVNVLNRLAAVYARRRQYSKVAETCLSLLSLAPNHAQAVARLNRAAVRLGDASTRRQALAARSQLASTVRQRGRALALLARFFEDSHELDVAVATADAALTADPTAADAALLVLRHAYRLPAERAVITLGLVRSVLGDSQPLLATLARAALAGGDVWGQLQALQAWCELTPMDPEPVLGRLALCVQGENAAAIEKAANAALQRDVINASTAAAVQAAVSRLGALGAAEQGCRLAMAALDLLGDASLVPPALDLAERIREPVVLASVLERALPFSEPEQRVEVLRQLARLYRDKSMPAAEVRAHLRLLALAPDDFETLDRLAALYAGNGDANRLLAVLSLKAEGAQDGEQKRKCLLDVAAASFQVGNLEGAANCVRNLALQCASDRECVLRALGSLFWMGEAQWALEQGLNIARDAPSQLGALICEWLLNTAERELKDPTLALRAATSALESFPSHWPLLSAMERLALSLDEIDTAMRAYTGVIDHAMGPHGRRALTYRAGHWLEKAGRPKEAVKHYLQTFDMWQRSGAALKAVERLAREFEDLATLVAVYRSLSDARPDVPGKTEWLCKAGALCLDGLKDPQQAFDVFLEAWKLNPDGPEAEQIESRLQRAADLLKASNPEAGEEALALLARQRREHSAAAGAEDASLDGEVVAASSLGTDSLEAPDGISDEVVPAPSFETEVNEPPDVMSDGQVLLASSPNLHPGKEADDALDEQIVPVSAPTGHKDEDGMVPASQTEEMLYEAARKGDADAIAQLAALVLSDATRLDQAGHLLRTLVIAEPWRSDAIRQLNQLAFGLGSTAELVVTSEILSLFDSAITAPSCPMFHAGLWSDEERAEILKPKDMADARQLLELVWQGAQAIPRFRNALSTYGVEKQDRVFATPTAPIPFAYGLAAENLNIQNVALYLKESESAELFVVPASPPAIIGTLGLENHGDLLPFAFGRCLVLALPEHALFSAIDETGRRELLDAVRAAFDPPEHRPAVGRHAAELAVELWHSVPMPAQRQVRALLQKGSLSQDDQTLYDNAHRIAARGGLMTAGSVRSSLLGMVRFDEKLMNADISSPEGFSAACQASPAFAEVIRFALSDSYLTARAKAG